MGNRNGKTSRRSSSKVAEPPSRLQPQPQPETVDLPDGITLIWLDPEQTSATRSMLKRLNSSVLFYENVDLCLNLLYGISNSKTRFFVIVSGKFSQEFLSNLSQLKNVDSVFIFCLKPERYEDLMKKYSPHLIGIFSDEQQLKSSVEIELNEFSRRAPAINFFNQNQNATRDLTYDAASFLWFQMIQQVLRETFYGDKQKNEMLDYCRKQYARQRKRDRMFADIREFEMNYRSDLAFEWYTRHSFIYRLINSALRTEDIDGLYFFRFYISDLCRQIAVQSKIYRQKLINDGIDCLIVYRGCRMTEDELNKLKEIVGNDEEQTSINGFISTSLERRVAEEFEKSHSNNRSNVEKVLWTIKIDTHNDEILFADLTPFSVHPEEAEVLLNIGTTFLLDKIELNEATGVWQIAARVSNGGSRAVRQYLDLVQQELEETNLKIILGILLIDMGKFLTARNYFQDLIDQTSEENFDDRATLFYNLGLTYRFEGELSLAETSFLQAIEYLRKLPKRQRNLVRTYNALGHVYQINGELQEAIGSFQCAESICPIDDIVYAQTFTYMAQYYLTKGCFAESMEKYERALKILRQHLPEDHHRIGILLCEMGNVRRREKRNEEAFELYQRAETILLSKLPRFHPCIAFCWSNLGLLYLQMNDYEKAKEFHQKALETYRRVLPADHPNIHISEENLHCQKLSCVLDSYLQVSSQV